MKKKEDSLIKNIRISAKTREALTALKRGNDSYDTVIKSLLDLKEASIK